MIRKIITPNKSNFNLVLEFPDDYLGQELELITFKKEEGLETDPQTKLLNFSDKYKNAFNYQDLMSFNNHTQKIRKEWENT
jgi:hypothetical protein